MSAGDGSPPTHLHTPTRDASTIKNVLYGPGHEKFPSWPMPAAVEAPRATRAPPTGGSQRSKSWTDHTNYPKENLIPYSRPYMRRSHSAYPPQLKTVVERCEKNQPDRKYLHRMERSSKSFENSGILSPPERDIDYKGGQSYEISFEKQTLMKDSYNIMMNNKDNDSPPLTQADLEKYTRNYDEETHQHQKQPSYAQSEGYHSYVSSTDSTSTSFLDRLGHDMDVSVARGGNSWDRDSVVTTSSSSASSSETLKWHGSLSDVSVASSSFSLGRQQLIAHSARVQTPQRHNSDSVSYIKQVNDEPATISDRTYPTYSTQRSAEPQRENNINKSPPQRSVAERVHQYEEKVTKYTYLDPDKKTMLSDPALKAIQKKALLLFYERHQGQNKPSWKSESQLSVKSSNNNPKPMQAYEPIDCGPDVPDQKETVRNNPHISKDNPIVNNTCQMNKPYNKIHPQPSTVHDLYKQQSNQNKTYELEHSSHGNINSYKHHTVTHRTVCETLDRRTCNYNENHSYKKPSPIDSENNVKENFSNIDIPTNNNESHNSALQGPVILGPAISLDDWVPERPPKNQQHLRSAFPDLYPQVPPSRSPDLPLPSPPTYEDEVSCNSDEPFPPPPFEIVDQWKYQQEIFDHHPPTDFKGMNNIDVAFQNSNNKTKNIDHNNEKAKERFFHLGKKAQSNNVPVKPRLLNREYPNSHKIHEAQRRNSFSKTHESSRDMTLRNVNIRASVREIVRYPTSPTKQNISAQRQLYRSVTIDDSAVTPKKPINPFLRSTSMKVDDQKTDTLMKSYNSSHKSNHLDKSKDQYNCMQKVILNEKIAVATSEKVVKDVGKFRAEPLHPIDPIQSSKSHTMNHKYTTSPRYQIQRPIRPQDFKPHENEINRKKCLSPPTKLSDEGPGRLHQCPLQQSHAEHAIVFNHQKPPILQKPCLSPHSPTASTLGHSINETIEKSHNVAYPQEQMRSPNKMELSLETMMNGFKLVDSESTPLLSKLQQSIRESCANEEENLKKLSNNKTIALPKDVEIHHDKTPSITDEKIDIPTPIENATSQVVSVIQPEPTVTANCVEVPIKRKMIRHLKPRAQLPEEVEWRKFSTELALQLPAEDPMKTLLSQYEEYDSTIESICSFFEQELVASSSADDKHVKNDDSSKNDPETNSSESSGNSNESSNAVEKSVIIEGDEEKPVKTIKLKKAACETLRALTQALATEAGVLETEKVANEAVGADLSSKSGVGSRYTRLGVDVELVTSLIVALSVRFARMRYTCHSPERKASLIEKETKLAEQLQEAKALKENIDRRVLKFYATSLMQSSQDLIEEYDNFIYTTIKLVIYTRDVRDRLNLTQKLLETINTEGSPVSLNKSVA